MNKATKKIKLQDKTVANKKANEVKGGPVYMRYENLGGNVQPTAGLLLPAVKTV